MILIQFFKFFRDLSSLDNLKAVILWSLSPNSEEVRSAASYALGSVAVGCLNQYVPFILQEIETQPKRQYLLLHSLKEVSIKNFKSKFLPKDSYSYRLKFFLKIITWQSNTPGGILQLQPFVPAIWQQLFRHCECAEEGTRNVVAECLGKILKIIM